MAKQAKQSPANYINNPFTVAIQGITLLFDLARGVAFFLVALSIASLFRADYSTNVNDPKDAQDALNQFTAPLANFTTQEWLIAIGATAIIVLAIAMIGALFGGVSAYTSLKLSRGERVSIGEAFREAFQHLWSFLWLQIIVGVKIFLWTLLFIIPGIIMATRYSLASTAFFDDKKQLRGNAAVKESLRLTRGAWITTYGSHTLFNFITFGIISSIVTTGANAILYRQFDKLDDNKPAAHWLSWVALFLPFVFLLMLLFLIFVIIVVLGVTGFSE